MSPLLQALLVPVVLTLIGAVVWLLVDRRRMRSVERFEARRERPEITGTGFFGEHSDGDSLPECHDPTPPDRDVVISWCKGCGAFRVFGGPWQLPTGRKR